MILTANRPDGAAFTVVTTAVDPGRHARALAAVQAARAELVGCPPIRVRWFADLEDSGCNGFTHALHPGVWLWSGLALENVARVARHETLHAWGRAHGVRHSEQEADVFGRGESPVLRIVPTRSPEP